MLDLQEKVTLYNGKKLYNHLEYGVIKASVTIALANSSTFLSVIVMPPQLFVAFSLNETILLAQQLCDKTK